MNDPPLIGITTYAANENGEVTLPQDYVDSVRRAGGIPILIAPGESQTGELLDRLDGMILAGGGDICPTCYEGEAHDSVYMVDVERDTMELQLANQLVERDVPTLAICRGFQIVNVMLGGTLHAHLPDEVGEAVLHRAPPRKPIPHAVSIDAGSRIAQIMGASQVEPMSWHHQALNSVAPQLAVVARAPDGIIEAADLPSHRWFVGVQWHPEITAGIDVTQQRLFDELIRAARVQSPATQGLRTNCSNSGK